MFKQRLKQLRAANGLTQADLANILGLVTSSIGKYEGRHDIYPSPSVLIKMAQYFNVSIDYILGATDDPTPPNNKSIVPQIGNNPTVLMQSLSNMSDTGINQVVNFARFVAEQERKEAAGKEKKSVIAKSDTDESKVSD